LDSSSPIGEQDKSLEGVKDFMVTLVLARTNPGAISVARNALRRV